MTLYSSDIKRMDQQKEQQNFIDAVRAFIKLFNDYFGYTPTHQQIKHILYSKDKDAEFADLMFKANKNPFLAIHPERVRLMHLIILINNHSHNLNDGITLDDKGCIDTINRVKIN